MLSIHIPQNTTGFSGGASAPLTSVHKLKLALVTGSEGILWENRACTVYRAIGYRGPLPVGAIVLVDTSLCLYDGGFEPPDYDTDLAWAPPDYIFDAIVLKPEPLRFTWADIGESSFRFLSPIEALAYSIDYPTQEELEKCLNMPGLPVRPAQV